MKYKLEDKQPTIAEDCYIAPSADLIGDVRLSKGASVWFNCVLRADNEPINIGDNSNVQDGAVLHVDPGFPINVGSNVTIGHNAMVHGCTIGDNSLIGINAVVLNGAKIGKHCIVGAGALVTEGTEIPDGMMALGAPAKPVKEIGDGIKAALQTGADHYVANGQRYEASLSEVDNEQ